MEGKLWKDAIVKTAMCYLIVMSHVYIVAGGAQRSFSNNDPCVMVQ